MPFWRPRGCVLWLDFLEPSGNVAYDKSGYGNHGTIYGAQRVRALGRWGLKFDGVDDYVLVPSLTVGGSVTVEMLVRPNYPHDDGLTHMLLDWLADANNLFRLHKYSDGRLTWVYKGQGVYKAVSKTYPFSAGTPLHIVGVFDADTGELRLYANKECIGTVAGGLPITTASADLYIATRIYRTDFHAGIISLVRIFNRVLEEREICADHEYFFGRVRGEM